MSEETKVKVVEDENPSTAEKETKALKKMGANIGEETITKVDLRKPKEEEQIPEQNLELVTKSNKTEAKEKIPKKEELVVEEVKEEPVVEEVKEEKPIEAEVKPEAKIEPAQKQEKLVKEESQPEVNIPEGITDLVNFINETGGSMEDYIKLNKNYGEFDDINLVREYYNTTKPHLDNDEISFLVKDNFSYDKELEDSVDIKRKQLAFKEEVAKAKDYLNSQKEKYYKEVKTTGNLSAEQQKAVDFFNRYNNEQQQASQIQEKASNTFKQKTNEVFNQEFKGFDFDIEDKKYRFKLKDIDKTKDTQMDIMNVVGSYLDENNSLKDGYGYHKALFAAKNADSIANHFYQLGKTEAVKEISAESKNINMDPRQTSSGYVESGGIKVRAITGDDSSKLRIKLRNKK